MSNINNMYKKMVATMSNLEKYYYTFEAWSSDDTDDDFDMYMNGNTNGDTDEDLDENMNGSDNHRKHFMGVNMNGHNNGKCNGQKFYGDYQVDFTNEIAYITVNSNDSQFNDQETYYDDENIYFREEGQGWDILSLTEEDYDELFEQDGDLSIFDFESFNTRRMTAYYEGNYIVFTNIYMADYDFEDGVYNPYAYRIKMKVDKLTNLVKTITFKDISDNDDSGCITYKYKLVAVNDMVDIQEPF